MNKLTIVPSVFGEIFSYVAAANLLVYAKYKKMKQESIDPPEIKKNKTPIVLIHGKGFNKTEFIIGMQYLKKDIYGSIRTFDYAGLLSNDHTDTIEDYCKITHDVIESICNDVNVRDVILIGHSLGGLIASSYAENIAKEKNINVRMVITIATPWHEPPLLKYFDNGSLLNQQMKEPYLMILRQKVLKSIKNNEDYQKKIIPPVCYQSIKMSFMIEKPTPAYPKYFTISSKDDLLVPKNCGKIDDNLNNHLEVSCVGHNMIIASPTVWKHICKLIDEIYK